MPTAAERGRAELQARRAFVQASTVRRRRRKVPPQQRYPSGARARYSAQLVRLVSTLEARVLAELEPELNALAREAETVLALDAVFQVRRHDTLADRIARIFRTLTIVAGEIADEATLERAAGDAGKAISDFNRTELNRQFLSVVGVDIGAAEPWLGEQLGAFVRENVSLVKGISEREIPKLEELVLRGVTSGTPVRELQKQIRARFRVSKNRARLIARDQTNKFNARLTRERQVRNGVTHYVWQTSQDERVRDSHRALNNKRQAWADPPIVDGVPSHPGQPINCRCNALPDIAGVLADL